MNTISTHLIGRGQRLLAYAVRQRHQVVIIVVHQYCTKVTVMLLQDL